MKGEGERLTLGTQCSDSLLHIQKNLEMPEQLHKYLMKMNRKGDDERMGFYEINTYSIAFRIRVEVVKPIYKSIPNWGGWHSKTKLQAFQIELHASIYGLYVHVDGVVT